MSSFRHTTAACQHCLNRQATRPRGLCGPCHGNWQIRILYDKSERGPDAQPGPGQGNKYPALPEHPTWAAPGTSEKIAVLEARVAAGEGLWHPDDADPE